MFNRESFVRNCFVYSHKRIIFAACSNENARLKIRKSREIKDYNDIKKMEKIKSWKTQSVKHKVAMVLILDGINFSFNSKDGIVFAAPESYVERMKYRMVTCYGCSLKPITTEY